MSSIIRRAGAHVAKVIPSAADPAAVANATLLYAKTGYGLFACNPDGTIYQASVFSETAAGVGGVDPAVALDMGASRHLLDNTGADGTDQHFVLDSELYTDGRIHTFVNVSTPLGTRTVTVGHPSGTWTSTSNAGALQLIWVAASGSYQQVGIATGWNGGGDVGSISGAFGAFADIDFSALGTVDWCYIEPGSDLPSQNTWHSKQTAGWLMRNFRWKTDGTARVTNGPFAQTMTSSAADDLILPALAAAAQNARGITKAGANALLQLGFSTAIPCSPTPRTVLVQGTVFSVNLRITASMSNNNGPGAPAFLDADAGGAGAGAAFRAEFTFSGPIGTWLYLDAQVITCYGVGNQNFSVGQLACR